MYFCQINIINYWNFCISVDVEENDPIWGGDISLHVHTYGPVLHVFINGKHVGNITNSHYFSLLMLK